MQQVSPRSITEELELNLLHEKASKSKLTRGRARFLEPCNLRTEYQRDRDRIIHSKSFRRLKYKTQVFLAPKGDHFRTRMTHTLEVTQIARTISRALRLNEDLTEAIALAHDIGHTPFGHTGEHVLNALSSKCFKHYAHSARVVTKLDNLNLTYEVIDGIYYHSKGTHTLQQQSKRPITLEGHVVRLADLIAYINHDIDDAQRAGILEHVPSFIIETLGEKYSQRINTLVSNLVETSLNNNLSCITFSDNLLIEVEKIRKFLTEEIYNHPKIIDTSGKAEKILIALFKYYSKTHSEQETIDYIAGMSDGFAIETFRSIYGLDSAFK